MVNAVSPMQRWSCAISNIFYLIAAVTVHRCSGGTCWEYIDDTTSLCRKAFRLNMTYDECCGIQGSAAISWTPHEITSNIFFWNFLSDGANKCHRCHKNCSAVVCEQGKSCRMVKGKPTCVCKPHCEKSLKSRGTVCGSDGQKYRNYCALQRHKCITKQRVTVEYFGKCRNSCSRVQCETGKHCLQDQNGVPHCVRCHDHCNLVLPDNPADYLCGESGKTYSNTCELRADICKTGRSIRISHPGRCVANETCDTLACGRGMNCLISAESGRPVCMNCESHCLQPPYFPVCGTDRQTYSSYCHMINSSCKTGIYVSTHRKGPCKSQDKRRHVRIKTKKRFEVKLKRTKAKNKKRRRHRDDKTRRHKKDIKKQMRTNRRDNPDKYISRSSKKIREQNMLHREREKHLKIQMTRLEREVNYKSGTMLSKLS